MTTRTYDVIRSDDYTGLDDDSRSSRTHTRIDTTDLTYRAAHARAREIGRVWSRVVPAGDRSWM